MIFRSHTAWFVSVAVTLLSVGASSTRAIAQSAAPQTAIAQTTYQFDVSYDTEVILTTITSEVSEASISGYNPEAAYGLTNFESTNYSQFDSNAGVYTFVADAAQFGLEGLPVGTDVFFGSGEDKLFGTSNATAAINYTNGTLEGYGTITITGGAGRFSGATGTLNFFETESLNQDPTAPLRGQAFLNGSFQTPQQVPEPRINLVIAGGIIGASFLLRQRRLRSAGES
ncbi:hypothetical protein [Mastigocladopsis repens]|uniref:hypothetical protein n=1 Tax=Mastigocladopsis repens TaxID=221287 RepID=UPI0002E22D1C|nr:hypothetical protein [Mastigocladopsis repens]